MEPSSQRQEGAQLRLAALEEINERKARRESIRAARSISKTQAMLDEELWRVAESGSAERVAALLEAGATPAHRSHIDIEGKPCLAGESVAEVGPLERSAFFGNERFLSAMMSAGFDPFENVEGWVDQMCEGSGPPRFGSGSPKHAAWLDRACSAPLTPSGALAVGAWAREMGVGLAGSSVHKFAWRPAMALARLGDGWSAEIFASLLGMVSGWERWSRGKDVPSDQAEALASELAARGPQAHIDKDATWTMAVRVMAGPLSALALSGLGEPSKEAPTPAAMGLQHGKVPGGPASMPLLLACVVRGAYELLGVLARLPAQRAALAAESLDVKAWAWSRVDSAKQAKELRALGLSLSELDRHATALGYQMAPRLAMLAAPQPHSFARLDEAIAIGRLAPELWFEKGPGGVDGFAALIAARPQDAAKVEARMIGKGAGKAAKALSPARRL